MFLRVDWSVCFFFFQAEDGIRDYKVTGVQTCALPIYVVQAVMPERELPVPPLDAGTGALEHVGTGGDHLLDGGPLFGAERGEAGQDIDRESTCLNSSHLVISYAVFCLEKKKHIAH